jgi:transcription elongation factor GreA
MAKEEYITQEGLEELKKELNILKTDKTREIAELIKHTASFGDLKENFAYHDAKEKQAFLHGRIKELEHKIKYAKVVEKKQSDKVQVGSDVTVLLNGEKQKFSIVASDRVDPLNGMISYESPIGKALLNKSANQEIGVEIGGNKVKLKILKIE